MVSIKGHYVYDDDDLTPGNKKEGGLHQNLYDSDGNLKGNARFIPDQEQYAKPDPEVIYETVYVHETVYVSHEENERQARKREAYELQQARKREENAELVANVVGLLVAVAKPHVKRLWHEKARPVIEARRAKKATRKARKSGRPRKPAAKQPIVVEATVVDSGRELAVAEKLYRTDMSSAEAQARYLAALAARAFSDEQMKLVSNANIIDGESLAELQRTLVELPPQQVKGIIEAVEANPSVLSGDLLAELGNLLGLDRAEPEAVPMEKRRISDGHRR